MKADAAKQIVDSALTTLSNALDAGKSEQLTAYLRLMGTFHRYSWGNVLMILSQKQDATHVAGFQAWKKLGRFVRKGEKGIVILAPMVFRNADPASNEVADTATTGGTAGEGPAATRKPMLRFRGVYVFDVSQTEGQALPEPARVGGDPGACLQRLKDAIQQSEITLTEEDLPPGIEGLSRGGSIVIQSGLADAQAFSVLVHEWAHELLHQVKAIAGEEAHRPASKVVRETEAEAVAFVVNTAIGLETGSASSDYIAMHAGDAKTLAASLERVQRTATVILASLHPDADTAPSDEPNAEVVHA
jgi:hypothetical protein